MKVRTLISITIVLGVSMLQDVSGGKTVTEKKLKSWSENNVNDEENNLKRINLKKNKDIIESNISKKLINIIQYVVTNTFNNSEFRTFLIKRFLHNYVRQASKYLNKIKNLKMKMDPKAAQEDDIKDRAMKKQ